MEAALQQHQSLIFIILSKVVFKSKAVQPILKFFFNY
jgi:hypothetical protein